MSVSVPGSAASLNTIGGFSTAITMTNQQMTDNGNAVFRAGTWLYNTETKKVYLTDGTSKISKLKPYVDEVLTPQEKEALSKAFETGEYKAAAKGVVVHGTDGKIDDVSFKFIEAGHVKHEYLDLMGDDGKVKLDCLPDTVRNDWNMFADIAARDAATEEQKRGFAFVADASADPTVKKGWALYAWATPAQVSRGAAGPQWIKIAEGEGLDVPNDVLVSHKTVEEAGALMYDHPLMMSMDLATAAGILNTAVVPTITANDVAGTAAEEIASGISFSTGRTGKFKVTVTVDKCSMKNFDGAAVEAGTPVTKNATVDQINSFFAAAKIVVGDENGTVKIDWLGQSKTINVTKNA